MKEFLQSVIQQITKQLSRARNFISALRLGQTNSVSTEAHPVPSVATIWIKDEKIRALERARKRHDIFVKPQGPRPVPGAPRAVKKMQRTAMPIAELNIAELEPIIADVHHNDGKDVLYNENEIYGVFNFRDTILDQLDKYFQYLRRMKKTEPEVYELYRKIGGVIVPYAASGLDWDFIQGKKPSPPPDHKLAELSPWFLETRPTFGCVSFAESHTEKMEENTKTYFPKFMYFLKFSQRPAELQPIGGGGDIYVMTAYFDKKDRKEGSPQQWGIHVSPEGTMRALKIFHTTMRTVQGKKGTFKIPQRQWGLPDTYKSWAKEKGFRTADDFLIDLFRDTTELAGGINHSMIRVSVKKEDVVAVFGVEIKHTAYFFKDRDISLTVDGKKKRIFHVVRPHLRKGSQKGVKMHFRGLREFKWAGYDVLITVPERDHIMIDDFAAGMRWIKKGAKTVMLPAIGDMLSRIIRSKAS